MSFDKYISGLQAWSSRMAAVPWVELIQLQVWVSKLPHLSPALPGESAWKNMEHIVTGLIVELINGADALRNSEYTKSQLLSKPRSSWFAICYIKYFRLAKSRCN